MSKRALLLLGVLTLWSTVIRAQMLPDAGRLLNDTWPESRLPERERRIDPLPAPHSATPAAPQRSDVRFNIALFHIAGMTAFSEVQLQELLFDLKGNDRNLETLEEVVSRITRFYRQHGYMLARAYFPEQDIESGAIEIHVLEGRLGNIGLHNTSRLSDVALRRRLERIGIGQALNKAPLESSLLLLSDIPGIVIRSTLVPGASVGATDLEVNVSEGRRAEGDLTFDNYGNRYSGEYHASANVMLNNPTGIGDQIQMSLSTSGSEFNYGRFSYQVPVNDIGTRVGVSYAAMAYRLGEDFSVLDAHGVARIASIFATHPFLRSRSINVSGQVRFENKVLVDRIGLIASGSEKHLNNLTVGIVGDAVDGLNGGAQSQVALSVTTGNLKLDSSSADLDAVGHRSQGGFVKVNTYLMRLQRLDDADSLLLQLSAQLAGNNLDSAEKMSLGGPYAVRAYPSGEAPADDAVMLNLEWRRNMTPQLQAMLFGDLARGRLNHNAIATDGNNLRTLSGVGIGAKWSNPDGYRLQATLSWRTDSAPVSDHDRTPRLWMQFGRIF